VLAMLLLASFQSTDVDIVVMPYRLADVAVEDLVVPLRLFSWVFFFDNCPKSRPLRITPALVYFPKGFDHCFLPLFIFTQCPAYVIGHTSSLSP
jgi:hypothetical protein